MNNNENTEKSKNTGTFKFNDGTEKPASQINKKTTVISHYQAGEIGEVKGFNHSKIKEAWENTGRIK